jgi:branched-chain amino acid transport system permease protein
MGSFLLLDQLMNGFQLGVMLFLMSAGLTLTFGIMNFINLTHGSYYMLGAFLAAVFNELLGNFFAALVVASLATFAIGLALDRLALRKLYARSHLDQVLGTFGLLIFFNDLVILFWGVEPRFVPVPDVLTGAVALGPDNDYPLYRLAITAMGLLTAFCLYVLIMHTRAGMLIRAGASNRQMLDGLGINVQTLFSLVFALGAALAGFAGMMTAPLIAVQTGMGDEMLIVAFVIIVIGSIGSVRGAFVAAILVGVVDTMGRFLLPKWLGFTVGPAVASMAIYVLMALVLVARRSALRAAPVR